MNIDSMKKCIKFTAAAAFLLLLVKYGFVQPQEKQMKPNRFSSNQPNKNSASDSMYMRKSLPRPVYNGSLLHTGLSEQVTVVTAYFNLGRFQKGEDGSTFFEPNLYMHWIRVFSRIKNPVIAYFDTKQDLEYFVKQRHGFGSNLTKTMLVRRDDLWAFGLYRRIAAIIAKPNYPRFEPNTVLPEYSCVMHAKYELMQKSIVENPFRTKYFSWLDVGLFRAIAKAPGPPFELRLPPKFDESKVAYSEVFKPFPNRISLEQIFYTNLVWVCGCFFIAEQNVMLRWAQEYMKYTDYFLEHTFTNTDQQVIYAVFNRGKPQSSIQTYWSAEQKNPWFYLGYLCSQT